MGCVAGFPSLLSSASDAWTRLKVPTSPALTLSGGRLLPPIRAECAQRHWDSVRCLWPQRSGAFNFDLDYFCWMATDVFRHGISRIVWAVIWYLMFRDYPDSSKFVSESELKHIHEGQLSDRSVSDSDRRVKDRTDGWHYMRDMLTNPSFDFQQHCLFRFRLLAVLRAHLASRLP